MDGQEFEKMKKQIPDTPGVYYFWNKNQRLYIGKATSIRDRVSSYFKPEVVLDRGPKISKMVQLAEKITFEKTESVLDALILESKLIKKHQPYYNTLEKDDRSFYFVCITKEPLPRVYLERESNLNMQNLKAAYGPFVSGPTIREALKILRRIFPFRDKKSGSKLQERFYTELGLLPDTTTSEKESAYNRTIKYLQLFFEGKKLQLYKKIESDMKDAAKEHAFEEAGVLRNMLYALQHIRDVSLIKDDFLQVSSSNPQPSVRVDALDVAHTQGSHTYGVSVTIEDGMPFTENYRMFKMRAEHKGDDYAALRELLERRLKHPEWGIPKVLVIDGGPLHKKVAEHMLMNDDAWCAVNIVAVTKDEKHKPVRILGDAKLITKLKGDILKANAEAHRFAIKTHRNRRDKIV